MKYPCMGANETGSLVFTDYVIANKSSRLISEVYRAIDSAQSNPAKQIRWSFTVQMDNEQKHTMKAMQELLKAKKWIRPSQSFDLNPTEHYFPLLKTKLTA